MAHGADAILFFQLRQSRGACEKYHGAVLDHAGRTDTRVFREVAALGAELAGLGDATLGARTPARVALLLDWDSWWARRDVRRPQPERPLPRCADRLPPGAVDARRDGRRRPGHGRPRRVRRGRRAPAAPGQGRPAASRLEAVVERGGSLLTTFLSGRVDEDDNAFLADAPGRCGTCSGLRVEETDARSPSVANPVTLEDAVYEARHVFELVSRQGAEVSGHVRRRLLRRHPGRDPPPVRLGPRLVPVGATSTSPGGLGRRAVLASHGLIRSLPLPARGRATVRVSPDGARSGSCSTTAPLPVELRRPRTGSKTC